jgi:hypothetical protein
MSSRPSIHRQLPCMLHPRLLTTAPPPRSPSAAARSRAAPLPGSPEVAVGSSTKPVVYGLICRLPPHPRPVVAFSSSDLRRPRQLHSPASPRPPDPPPPFTRHSTSARLNQCLAHQYNLQRVLQLVPNQVLHLDGPADATSGPPQPLHQIGSSCGTRPAPATKAGRPNSSRPVAPGRPNSSRPVAPGRSV